MCAKKVILGVLLHVIVKMVNIIDYTVISCDEIIKETQRLFQQILTKRKR